jgi:hypothetical protein
MLAQGIEDLAGDRLQSLQGVGHLAQDLARLQHATAAHQGQDRQQPQVPAVRVIAPRLSRPVVGQKTLTFLDQALDLANPTRFARGWFHVGCAQRPMKPKGSRVLTGWDI